MKNDMSHNFKVVMFDIDACLIDSAPNLILTLDRAVFDTGIDHGAVLDLAEPCSIGDGGTGHAGKDQ